MRHAEGEYLALGVLVILSAGKDIAQGVSARLKIYAKSETQGNLIILQNYEIFTLEKSFSNTNSLKKTIFEMSKF